MNAPKQNVSPLRQRMIEDMRMRRFAAYLGRSPEFATTDSNSTQLLSPDLDIQGRRLDQQRQGALAHTGTNVAVVYTFDTCKKTSK